MEPYKVHIETTADPAGAHITQDELEKTAQKGEEIVDSITKGDRATANFIAKLRQLTPEQIAKVDAEMRRLAEAEEAAGRDASALRAQLQRIADVNLEKQVQNAQGMFASITAGSLAANAITQVTQALTNHLHESIELADQLGDLAGRAGVAASELQRIGNTASQNNGSIQGTADALSKLQISAQGAISGSRPLSEMFDRLGISAKDLKELSPDELFYRIADAVHTSSDRGRTYADVIGVMGRSSKDLFTTLELGSEQIRRTGTAIGVFSDETVQQLSDAKDAIAKFRNELTIFAGENVAAWAKVIGDSRQGFADFLSREVFGLSSAEIAKFNAVQDRAAEAAKKSKEGFQSEGDELESLAEKADQAAKSVRSINEFFEQRLIKEYPISTQIDLLRTKLNLLHDEAQKALPGTVFKSASEFWSAAVQKFGNEVPAAIQETARRYAAFEDQVKSLQKEEEKAADAARKQSEAAIDGAKKETKALDDPIKKLEEKIRLLREAQQLGSQTAGAKADELERRTPATGPAKVDQSYYENLLRENPDDINAKLALAALKEKAADAIKVAKETGEEAGKAITAIGDANKQGLEKVSASATETAAKIQPLFQPVADQIATAIPQAIAEGNQKLVAAVNAAVKSIRADMEAKSRNLQGQIDAIWRSI